MALAFRTPPALSLCCRIFFIGEACFLMPGIRDGFCIGCWAEYAVCGYLD